MTTQSTPLSRAGAQHLFVYRGYRFLCSTQPMGDGYRPTVVCFTGEGESGETPLPDDTEEIAYGTQQEAQRHAEQQAMRWVHDRTGTGQAQF